MKKEAVLLWGRPGILIVDHLISCGHEKQLITQRRQISRDGSEEKIFFSLSARPVGRANPPLLRVPPRLLGKASIWIFYADIWLFVSGESLRILEWHWNLIYYFVWKWFAAFTYFKATDNIPFSINLTQFRRKGRKTPLLIPYFFKGGSDLYGTNPNSPGGWEKGTLVPSRLFIGIIVRTWRGLG